MSQILDPWGPQPGLPAPTPSPQQMYQKPAWWNDKVEFDPATGGRKYAPGEMPAAQQFYSTDPATGKQVVNKQATAAARAPSQPAYNGPIPQSFQPQFGSSQMGQDYFGKTMTVNPGYYATPDTAKTLSNALGGSVWSAPTANVPLFASQQAPEQREMMIRLPGGGMLNAGMLAQIWNQNQMSPSVAWNLIQAYAQRANQAAGTPEAGRANDFYSARGGLQPVNFGGF